MLPHGLHGPDLAHHLQRVPLDAPRQLIAHGHIAINGRKVTSPSYQVKIDDEDTLDYALFSPYHNPEHPLRKAMEVEEALTAEGTAR